MKVLENTTDRLVMRFRPWKVAAISGGATLILAAVVLTKALGGDMSEAGRAALPMALLAAAFAVFARESLLTLDRPAGEFTLAIRSVLGRRETRLPLADIRQARAELHPKRTRDFRHRPLQRPVLVLQDGRIVPLIGAYSTGPETDLILSALKPWLQPRKQRKDQGRA